MTQQDYEWLKGFINFCINEICLEIEAGASLSDLQAQSGGLIFNLRDDLYTPRRHRVEIFYNFNRADKSIHCYLTLRQVAPPDSASHEVGSKGGTCPHERSLQWQRHNRF